MVEDVCCLAVLFFQYLPLQQPQHARTGLTGEIRRPVDIAASAAARQEQGAQNIFYSHCEQQIQASIERNTHLYQAAPVPPGFRSMNTDVCKCVCYGHAGKAFATAPQPQYSRVK